MSQLRDKLIQLSKEETLKTLLGSAYDTTPQSQKDQFLSVLGGQIERDVDKLIREEIEAFIENTPGKKRSKKLSIFVIIAEVILTILLGFMINANQWYYVAGVGLIQILVLVLPLFIDD
jgi:fatty-acid desaturase